MKKIHYSYLLVLMVVFGSCQKLDRELETDITQEQIAGSFVNVQNLLNGVYGELREGFLDIDGEAMMASTTDEAEHTDETNTVQQFNQGSWNAANNPADVWGPAFRAVRRTNLFLETADPAKVNLDAFKTDPTTLALRMAEVNRWRYEARFLRAFFYFELVKRYGGVPIITRTLSEQDIAATQRNTLEQCIKFLSDECDSAATVLPVTYATGELGRATKGAALSLKSRVLLYAASDLFNSPSWAGGYSKTELISLPAGDRNLRWKAAADAAKAVIDLAGTGYGLATNYRSLFTTFNSPEIIFTRRNAASNTFEIANYPIGFDRGRSGTTPTQDLVDAYEIKENATTAVPFDWSNPAHAANPYATTGATARDPRLFASVVVNNSTFSSVASITRNVQLWEGGRDGLPIPLASKTGYYLRKYVNESLNLPQGTTGVHSWIYFRMAEIYLNYAEALNEYSPGAADIKIYVDRVRTRTGVAMPGMPEGTQAEVRQRIRNERRIELAFEDHRSWDVRRWMIAPATIGVPVRGVKVIQTSPGVFTYTAQTVESRVFQPKMYLFPISQVELSVAPGLVQNPLW
ncbi:MAG: RagB/SusD family nutrient uptake outer membrane protein [Gloeobacteraceae cyanobacterium ES-bin-316]|nr:RagB/SusD family nutrient uptake outer membrane protein [Ferruginibacter sp.]